MLKLIITAIIIYFLVRSIAMKPWLNKGDEMDISSPHNADKSVSKDAGTAEGEYVDYEEID